MKILLVTKLFPPDSGVSTLRMNFFYTELSRNGHEVDVLKYGDTTDFLGNIKTVDRNLFKSFLSALLGRRRIRKIVAPLLAQYDMIFVSAAPYELYEIAYSARYIGIPFILDMRDLPNLTSSEQKGEKPQLWLSFKSWAIDLYIKKIARNAVALLCVGTIATALTQLKFKNIPVRILNVHNGFNLSDLNFVREGSPVICKSGHHTNIGCVGNVFRFRDTFELRDILCRLNQRKESVRFYHWGKMEAGLLAHVKSLENIQYIPRQSVPRPELLQELHSLDGFLLACSEDLIWEPTTSVFDYVLYDKPVIFAGLRNNEAYCILRHTRSQIVHSEDIKSFDFAAHAPNGKTPDLLSCYSREYYMDRLLSLIQ